MAVDWRRRRPLLGNVDRRPERAGDQADRPAVRAPGPAGRRHPDRRRRRHHDDRRLHGVFRHRGLGRADRHGELRRAGRVDAAARRTPRGASPSSGGRALADVVGTLVSCPAARLPARQLRPSEPAHARLTPTAAAAHPRALRHPAHRPLPLGQLLRRHPAVHRSAAGRPAGGDEAFYFIADLHALTTVRDPDRLRSLVHAAAVDLVALGLDPERADAVRAVGRAGGDGAHLAADDGDADGAARAVPRLQGQEVPRAARPTPACSPIPC